jgi:hypothetical protein
MQRSAQEDLLMSHLSTAAWAAHEVGLATAIGGTLYGRTALQPALDVITSPDERDRVSADAWKRFSWINLAAHGVVAATWFVGRSMLSGREVTSEARTLTKVKDGLIVASLLTGIGCNVFGRMLGKRIEEGLGPEEIKDRAGAQEEAKKSFGLQRLVGTLGLANLATNIAILGVTTVLAMEGNKSARFPLWARLLP